MRGKSLLLTGLLILAAASALVYLLWTGPMINSPLGFDLFDEARVRERVVTTSKALLQTGDPLVLSLDHDLDGRTLRDMQILFGIGAANHWAHEEVPVQVWEYSFRERASLTGSFTNREDPMLQIRVSSRGVIQSLVIKVGEGELADQSLTTEEVRQKALTLMRLLGVNPAGLILTATQSREEDGEMIHEFTWKESLDQLSRPEPP